MKAYLLISASMLASVTMMASAAQAQQSPPTVEGAAAPAVASPPNGSEGIKDIVVTAERRSTTIQNTPISITAVTGDELIRRNLNTIDGVLRSVPSVVLQGNANGAYIYIRGVGSQQDTAIGGPAVNLNFDGIYQQQTDAPFASIYDVERVEVLRGPQGTLYGRNATAGSINIVTAGPTFDGIHAKANISYGNYSAIRGEAAFNLPLSDTFAIRAAAAINRHDGYLHPSGYDDARNVGGRLKALWQPSAGLKLLLATDHLHVGGVGPGAVDPLATHPDDAYYATAARGKIDIDYHRYYAQLDADVGIGTLTVLPAIQRYTKFDSNVLINNPPAVSSAAGQVNETQHTVEARLASRPHSPITWLIGAYYLHSNGATPYVADSQISLPNAPLTFPYLAGSETSSLAAFGQVTVPITTRFRVTGGLRYTHDKKSLTDETSLTTFLYPQVSFNSTTYKAGVEYDLAPHVLTYANISTGFKAGGLDQGFNAYKPEHLRAIQAGIKSRFFDNRIQMNAEAFDYKYRNFQAQYGYRCQNTAACSTISSFANTIVNAGSATVYGGEVEMIAQLWTGGRINASGAYTHSNFDRLVISPGTVNNSPSGCALITAAHPTYTCTVQPDQILTNQPLANAPKWSFGAGFQQDIPLANGSRFTVAADTQHLSGYWTLYRRPPQVPTESYQSPFWKTNATLTFTAPKDRWSVSVFVKNISNKTVVTSAVGPALTLAPPRTYGVQLATQF